MDEQHRSLFLGNGFNMSLKINTSYKSIYEKMRRKTFLVEKLPTPDKMSHINYNLEKIFISADKVIEYHLFEAIIDKCKAVIPQHNMLMKFFEEEEFDSYYTTNYDPLLYHNLLLLKETDYQPDKKFEKELGEICANSISIDRGLECKIIDLSKKNIYSISKKIFEREKNISWENKKMVDYMETLKKIKGESRSILINDGFVINQSKESKKQNNNRYMTWEKNNTSQNINYLHGALHIFKSDGQIRKYITNKARVDFINEVQKHSSDNFNNLTCVFQQESKDKIKKIESNDYLRHCLQKLKKLKGNLVIIGWAASKNDQHLIDAINDSDITKITYYYHRNKKKLPFHINNVQQLPDTDLPWIT